MTEVKYSGLCSKLNCQYMQTAVVNSLPTFVSFIV